MYVIRSKDYTKRVEQVAAAMFRLEHKGITMHREDFTIDISTHYGYIILPDELLQSGEFIEAVYGTLECLCKEYKHAHGKSHFHEREYLESGADHFTCVRAKYPVCAGTAFSRDVSGNNYERIIVTLKDDVYGRNRELRCKFAWYTTSLSDTLRSLENYFKPDIKNACQLFAIIVDDDLIIPPDTECDTYTMTELLNWKNIHVLRNYTDVCRYGVINNELMSTIFKKISKINATDLNSVEKHKYLELSKMYRDYKSWHKTPGFTMSESMGAISLQLCTVRGCAFEIIRQFGNWSIFATNVSKPIHDIHQEIHSVDYENIILTNDVCSHCNTPLYDDIYVILKDTSTVEADPMCAVCVHSRFKGGVCYNTGYPVYNDKHILARTKYPRSAEQLIHSMPVDEFTKDVLCACDNILHTEIMETAPFNIIMYIGSKTTTYMAFCGSMACCVEYLRKPSTMQLWEKKHWTDIRIITANIVFLI
jgi:hypothetical protein